jgi:hypothetical protein
MSEQQQKQAQPQVGGLNIRDHLTGLVYQVYGVQLAGVPRPMVSMAVEGLLVVLAKVAGIRLGAAAKPNGDIDIRIQLNDDLADRLFQDRLRRQGQAVLEGGGGGHA